MTLRVPEPGTHGARMPRGAAARASSRLAAGLYRMTGGRIGRTALLLTTVGARSGESRVAWVRRFDDGDGRWLVVGSAGGSARNPGWVHNLAANPDKIAIEIGRDRYEVWPEILAGDERATAWRRIVAEAPQFAGYETKTDREVPVIRLTAERPASAER
jgi:deazaflavin-dependent oxidoreductase (nitroreductase family)